MWTIERKDAFGNRFILSDTGRFQLVRKNGDHQVLGYINQTTGNWTCWLERNKKHNLWLVPRRPFQLLSTFKIVAISFSYSNIDGNKRVGWIFAGMAKMSRILQLTGREELLVIGLKQLRETRKEAKELWASYQ